MQTFLILIVLNLALICLIYYLINSELTKRRRIEEALGESEQRFSRAVLNAPLPIMIHAEDGEVVQINSAWQEMTGYVHADIPKIAKKHTGKKRN